MIRLIEALNFRCLRYVSQPLKDFQVLIGPNACGKTTLLDAIAFLGDLLEKGLDEAITKRTSNVRDLFFGHQGDGFQLAVELQIPQDRLEKLPDDQQYHFVRYEVSIGINEELEETHILDEQVILQKEPSEKSDRPERLLFLSR